MHLPVRRRKNKSGAGDEEVKMGYAFVRFLRKEDMDQCINTSRTLQPTARGRTLQVCRLGGAPQARRLEKAPGAGGRGAPLLCLAGKRAG